MESRIPKSTILHACIIKQQLIISNFEKEIKNLKDDIYGQDVIPSQGDYSAAERTEVLERYERELLFLQEELKALERINPDVHFDKVQPGAVVVTNHQTFFVSVSIEQIEVNDNIVFGLSIEAPIYQTMKFKKAGEHFSFKNRAYTILEVY